MTSTRLSIRSEAMDGGVGREQSDRVLSKRLLGLFAQQLPLFLLAGFALLIATGVQLAQPYLVKHAIGAALSDRPNVLTTAVVAYFSLVAVEVVARFAATYGLQIAGQRSIHALRLRVFQKVTQLAMRVFDRTPAGRLVTRLTNDIDAMGELFSSGAITAPIDVLFLVGVVVVMLLIDWRLSVFAFAAVPPLVAIVELIRRSARRAFRDIRGRTSDLNSYLAEQIEGVGAIQAFAREEACSREYGEINDAYRNANYRAIRYDALLSSVIESIIAICIAAVIGHSAERAGLLSMREAGPFIGTVVAFYEYIQRFFVPIRDLSTKYTVFQQGLAAAERVFALLDETETDDRSITGTDTKRRDGEDGAICFDAVTFGYGTRGTNALVDVSLHVKRGERVAIVGATGAGKSTITQLLLRLYDVSKGAIRVDGTDVRAGAARAHRSRFAVVPQDAVLFPGTLAANVAYPDKPDRARVGEILEDMGAARLLLRDGGLDRVIDERGTNLSAGERQLIAIARALYAPRPFVLLDEATAHVDSATEALVGRAVDKLLRGRTSIVIAHRLSTIRSADRIVVMHHGRIVEEGTHDALVARGGVYARLARLQSTNV